MWTDKGTTPSNLKNKKPAVGPPEFKKKEDEPSFHNDIRKTALTSGPPLFTKHTQFFEPSFRLISFTFSFHPDLYPVCVDLYVLL